MSSPAIFLTRTSVRTHHENDFFFFRSIDNHDLDFLNILECFTIILNAIGPAAWAKEAPDYPQVIFDTIKDNQYMVALLRGEIQGLTVTQPFDWLKAFVPLVRSSCTPQVFGNIVAKTFVYLGEELRHPGHSVTIQTLAAETLFKVQNSSMFHFGLLICR